eukprot:CAMPEP_0113461414 /NCGR_PEP_ID=MMETSP0014_2-20120614/11531_1 /TAXON_ID=2857 /ORGANISM="Nitzschia sp." /LENGTH=40 /DNA_ID=CAMNT_0000353179 /DNA_START=52 /DNA_END=171 /DNA_ORIENTATION=- /assembly_acc=CAM_ASM_000159
MKADHLAGYLAYCWGLSLEQHSGWDCQKVQMKERNFHWEQ